MSDHQGINAKIRIKSLDLMSFQSIGAPDHEVDKSQVNFQVAFDLQINADWTEAVVTLPINIFDDQNQKVLLGAITTRAIYDLTIVTPTEVNRLTMPFPLQLSQIFVNTLISSTRGMLVLLSKGTPFENVIIPIVNVNELFKNLNTVEKK